MINSYTQLAINITTTMMIVIDGGISLVLKWFLDMECPASTGYMTDQHHNQRVIIMVTIAPPCDADLTGC